MDLKNTSNNLVGVIGAGSFGTVIANLLAQNADVLLYIRKKEVADVIEKTRISADQTLAPNIVLTTELSDLTTYCNVIFPIIPSQGFRKLIEQLSSLLTPKHTLIHGIKGLDVRWPEGFDNSNINTLPVLTRKQVKTMSELITSETKVTQVGCIAGPNLSAELAQGQLAAVVVASKSQQVMETGQKLLRTDNFQVYTNDDIVGVELCGSLKNIIALGAGCLGGLGYGENAKAFLISRGLVEMIHIGKAMGARVQPFLGLAGIGDLIATCSSTLSRNYAVGYRLAQGESLSQILSNTLTAEGVYTVKVIRSLIPYYKMRAPITEIMYRILFEGLSVQEAINYLMKYPLNIDVDFI